MHPKGGKTTSSFFRTQRSKGDLPPDHGVDFTSSICDTAAVLICTYYGLLILVQK
jgi:hypothetical protein